MTARQARAVPANVFVTGAIGIQESKGDESRRGCQSVSPTRDQPTRVEQHHDR
jgi:hypothetical protein